MPIARSVTPSLTRDGRSVTIELIYCLIFADFSYYHRYMYGDERVFNPQL